MNTPAKSCPVCASSLRLSDTPLKVAPSPYLLAGELIFWVIAVAVFALTWSLGDISYAIAAIVAILVVQVVFSSSWQRSQRQAAAERGRYYCESCHRHFEGDALRQVTNLGRRSRSVSRRCFRHLTLHSTPGSVTTTQPGCRARRAVVLPARQSAPPAAVRLRLIRRRRCRAHRAGLSSRIMGFVPRGAIKSCVGRNRSTSNDGAT
jgi:hypothetical protein